MHFLKVYLIALRRKRTACYVLLLFVMQCILKSIFLGLIVILSLQYAWRGNSKLVPKDSKQKIGQNMERGSSRPAKIDDVKAILMAQRLRNRNTVCGYFSIDPFAYMRTGNLMFLYALAFSASIVIKRPLIIPQISLLTNTFNISANLFQDDSENENFDRIYNLYEPQENPDPEFTGLKLRLKCTKNYTFRGGFAFGHGFRYFEPHFAQKIRQEFSFLPPISANCNRIIEGFSSSNSVLVGVHVRRGDYLHPFNQWFGFVTLGQDYCIPSNSFQLNSLPIG